MKFIKNILIFIILMNFPLLSIPTTPGTQTNQGIGDINLSQKVPTNYTPPPPRNIVVFSDDGQENPKNELYGQGTFKDFLNNLFGQKNSEDPVIVNQLIDGLQSDPAPVLFVSESIMNSLIARQTIIQDFLERNDNQLTEKYAGMTKFNDPTRRIEFKKTCVSIFNNFILIKNSLDLYKQNPTIDSLNAFGNTIQKTNADNDTLVNNISTNLFNGDTEQASDFVKDIIFNYLPSYKALDLTQWKIGKTTDGCSVLVPTNKEGVILPTGIHYQDLDGFKGKDITNPFDAFNTDPKKALSNPHTDISAAVTSLINVIASNKDKSEAKLNTHIIGHGSGTTSLLEGTRAGIKISDFNKRLIPALEKSNTQTVSDETCYGGDINKAKAYQQKDGSTGVHSFTAITGNSSLVPLTLLSSSFISKAMTIFQQEYDRLKSGLPLSTKEELANVSLTLKDHRNFGTYFSDLLTSTAKAVSTFFKRDNTSAESIPAIPSIKPAASDRWYSADYVRDNILQISDESNIKDRAHAAYDIPFIYNLPKGGGFLPSKETILSPIIIKGTDLPFITPLSAGRKIHYLRDVTISDPSISITDFITQSIKPFIDQMNEIDLVPLIDKNIAEKTIIIDSLHVKEGIISLVVTKDYAMYTIKDESKGFFGRQPLHSIALSNNWFSWSSASTFKTLLKQGRDNATLEMLEVEKLQGISTTIHDRQEKLRLIQKLTEKIDWYNYSQTHDLSNENAIYRAVLDVINQTNNSLTADFLLDLSPHELEIIAHVINKNMDNVASTKTHAMLDQTFTMIHEEIIRRELITTMSEKMKFGNDTLIDWYMGLTLDAQILIKYEFNMQVEVGTILSQDPNTLTNKERAMLQSYLEETKSIATVATQIADLEAKINAVTSPRDETKFNSYLKDKYNELTDLPDKTAFIDWIIALDETEKAPIALDITAFFVKEVFNDPTLLNYQSNNLYITELFTLKSNLEQFVNSSGTDQTAILEKASRLNKGTPITLNHVNPLLKNSLQVLNQRIINSFETLNRSQQALLLLPNSVDIYAQIFKTLPFAKQTEIANNLYLLKNASNDVLNYQKSLLNERIKTAQTPADFTALSDDIIAAKIPLTTEQTNLLKTSFIAAEVTENKALSEHLPFLNAGSTGTTTFDPTIINQETGQPIIINNDPHKPTDPTNPTKPIDIPGQIIPNDTKDFENKDLNENKKRLEEEQKSREDAATAARDANEKAQEEFKKREETGNHEPVVFEI